MKKTTIIGAALLMAVFGIKTVKAQTCIKPPSCEELGYIYSAEDCLNGNNILKCPTDLSKMICSFDIIGNEGDILYADHSISSGVVKAKKPIGVIFDASNRLAISLEAQEFSRSNSNKINWGEDGEILNLVNCQGKECNDSGIDNTSAIMSYAQKSGKSFPLAEDARTYAPSGCEQSWCGAGKWSFISMGEIKKVLIKTSSVVSGFKALGLQFAPGSIRGFLTSSPVNDTVFNSVHIVSGLEPIYTPMSREFPDTSVLPNGWVLYAYRVIRY